MIRMGIIGFGGMASYHAKQLKDYKRVEIVGVFDLDPDRMAYAEACDYKRYAT